MSPLTSFLILGDSFDFEAKPLRNILYVSVQFGKNKRISPRSSVLFFIKWNSTPLSRSVLHPHFAKSVSDN